MRAAVVVNASAGALSGTRPRLDRADLESRLRAAGIVAQFAYPSPDRLCDAIDRALAGHPDLLVAGGGDGTVSAAASGLTGCPQTALGILPLGTLNHFCKDLGIGGGLEDAVAAIARGHAREVDVAQVNGRIFVNNCSVGAYPEAVRRRERLRERDGHPKMLAMALASLAVLRRLRVELRLDGRIAACRTPAVLVSNNRYDTRLLKEDRRERLDSGELWTYTTKAEKPLHLAWLAVRALFGRLEETDDFESWPSHTVRLSLPRYDTLVGIDGEVLRLRLPLDFKILPRALRVLAPEEPSPRPVSAR